MPNANTHQSALVGRKAFPKDDTYWGACWGFVDRYAGGGYYYLSGGVFTNIQPLLHRSEFTVHRAKKENN